MTNFKSNPNSKATNQAYDSCTVGRIGVFGKNLNILGQLLTLGWVKVTGDFHENSKTAKQLII